MMKQVSPEVESCNNQRDSLDDESIFESSINRVFVRLDMVDEEEHGKEELPLTLYRKPSLRIFTWLILLPYNFGSPFSLSKRQSIGGQ